MKRILKRLVGRLRGGRQPEDGPGTTPEPDVTADPTPIPISKRTRTALILAVLVLLGLIVWYVPSVLSTNAGKVGHIPDVRRRAQEFHGMRPVG